VVGRILYAFDEAALLGPMRALKVARDQGRKFKISLHLIYQSEGQIDEIWTPAGREAWFEVLSWRSYGPIRSLETAKRVSEAAGTFAARAISLGSNKGRQGRMFEIASASRGSSLSEHEVKRSLIFAHELMQDIRADERIVLYAGAQPIRCGAPIAFRRQDVMSRLGNSRFEPADRKAA
jgi:type IV secretion system protein VirD4